MATSHYKAESDALKMAAMSADIENKITLLQNATSRSRVDLSNLAAVQHVAYRYMEDCRAAGSFPTVLGLSASLGYSRQGINKFLRTKPDSPTAQFLEVTKDVFADIMSNAALFRNADAATTIFILKNCAGFVDRVEIEAVQQQDPLGTQTSPSELEQRILGSVIDDD